MPHPETYKLVDASLSDKTKREYTSALREFLVYCKEEAETAAHLQDVDRLLCDYIHKEYENPERQGRSHVEKVMCAILFYIPEVKGQIHFTIRAISGWKKIQPSQQVTPCPAELAVGLAYFLRREGYPEMGLGVLLSFDCHLRVGELISLKKKSIVLPTNGGAIILLSKTKTGTNQSVSVRLKMAHQLLCRRLSLLEKEDRVFPFTQNQFRSRIANILQDKLCLQGNTKITPHSLRAGGATRDFMTKRIPVSEIKDRGRWKSEKVMYTYVNLAQFALVEVNYNKKTKKALTKIMQDAKNKFNYQGVLVGWEEFMSGK